MYIKNLNVELLTMKAMLLKRMLLKKNETFPRVHYNHKTHQFRHSRVGGDLGESTS